MFVPLIPVVSLTICIFSSFLILTKKPKYGFDSIYAIFTICLAMPHLGHLFAHETEWGHSLLEFCTLFPYTFGPLLLLYIQNITEKERPLRKSDLLHFLPFAIGVIFFLSNLLHRGGEEFPAPEWERPERGAHPFGIFLSLSMLGYSVWIFFILVAHRKNLRNHFSNIDSIKDLRWMYWILIFFVISTGVHFFLDSVRFSVDAPQELNPRILRGAAVLAFSVFFCWFGVRQTVVYTSRELDHFKGKHSEMSVISPEEERKKYEKSGLREVKVPEYLDRIRKYMEDEKPYKDSEFSIDVLSEETDIPRFYITQILNERLGTNFYQFVNEYRIKDLIGALEKEKEDRPNFLSLSLEYGFNSKSTFNTSFKKVTGKTPSQYLEEISKYASS